jgi:cbb3-type cytochrome oxidase cytochrome c subunit
MRLIHLRNLWIVGFVILIPALRPAQALDAKTIVAEKCVSCHNVTGPAPSAFEGVLNRKAPDLFYAGSKFNHSWLVEWLQNPTIIRPSGVMFLNHIVTEARKDTIATDTVKRCPVKLGAEEAEAVTGYLMALKDSGMKTGVVDPAKKFRKHKAYRLFRKQMPCIGCHTIKFGKRKKKKGGISGPDLTNAGKRLNPDWVYARIADPQHWDPKTWMPKIPMSHKKRELLTLFILSMK